MSMPLSRLLSRLPWLLPRPRSGAMPLPGRTDWGYWTDRSYRGCWSDRAYGGYGGYWTCWTNWAHWGDRPSGSYWGDRAYRSYWGDRSHGADRSCLLYTSRCV